MRLFEAFVHATALYEVFNAASGPEGLELARKHRVDLIILDIRLPLLSGIDVARALKADPKTRNIPIIGTTALPSDKEILPRETSCDAFLHKPVSLSEFQATVRFLLPA